MTRATRPRRAASGYARGDETRQRIIDAALALFGERGYEGASTRDIAATAGVNAPALQYYFENKQGLYRACAESLINDVKARFAHSTAHATQCLEQHASCDRLIDAYLGIQADALDLLLAKKHLSHSRLFGREIAGEAPDMAAALLNRQLRQPMNALVLALLARIMGTQPDDTLTRVRMLTLKGQALAFYYPPDACLELLNWKQIDAERAAMIKHAVLDQTRLLLTAWSQA